jgi:hypothetical protein
MPRPMRALAVALLLAGCGAGSPSGEASEEPTATESAAPPSATATASIQPTAEATPSPAPSMAPRSLFGTWRTTLGGQNLSLNITESTYRIVRGPNSATGGVSVTDDRIEFFDSSLCAGTGVYRWEISEEGALSFFPVESEPCPGRAEALLVRYPDYSPPSGG